MKILNIDSSMVERSEGRPVSRGGGKKRDYALYELVEVGGERLLAYELYANRKPRMSVVAGFYVEDMEPNGFARRIKFNEVEDTRKFEVNEILKRRGYKEPIAFL